MKIECYEIIFNKKNNNIGISCNSREYQISDMLNDLQLAFIFDDSQSCVNIYDENELIISYIDIPEEYKKYFTTSPSIVLMCGLPSPYLDESPQVDAINIAINIS